MIIDLKRHKTVFHRIPGHNMSDTFAIVFHRLAVVVYGIYASWGLAAFFTSTPTLNTSDASWTMLFPIFVFLTAAPAGVGAMFFPMAARVELFAGSGFVALMLVYIFFALQAALSGAGLWSSVVLILSVLVMPICRTAMIVFFLILQASRLRESE